MSASTLHLSVVRSVSDDDDWPDDPTPELDSEHWEPTSSNDLYAVYNTFGRVMDRFTDKWAAVRAMRRWNAAFVIFAGTDIVARRGEDQFDHGNRKERRVAA